MVKINASNLSNIPPCPGKIFPVSFISILRLNNDSNKSPKTANIEQITAEIIQKNKSSVFEK